MLERKEFDVVVNYLIADDTVLKAIRKEFPIDSTDLIAQLAFGESPQCNGVNLSDFLQEILCDEGRLYSRFLANGTYGKYDVDIRGLGGVYFYEAPDFGKTGYYLSIDDAASAVINNWNDNLVTGKERRYRKPFVNAKVEISKAEVKKAETLKRARALLSNGCEQDSPKMWWEVLNGAPVWDVEIAAALLDRWFNFSRFSGRTDTRLFKVTMASTVAVLRQLRDTGRAHVVQQISEAAKKDLISFEADIPNIRGPARMSIGNELGYRQEFFENLQASLHALSSDPAV